MSAQFYDVGVKSTTGLQTVDRDIREMRKDARRALSKSATVMRRAYARNLSKRRGPSAPGDPPARVEGALRDTVGKDRPRRDEDNFSVAIGIGVGKAKANKVAEWKARGINVYAYAALHERGGIGAGGRRYPPRPFARPAEEETEAEIRSILEDGLR